MAHFKLTHFKLTTEQQKKISSAIEAAESKTSGQFAAMFVSQSRTYRWVHLLWALLGALGACSYLGYAETRAWGFLSLREILLVQSMGALVGVLLSLIPP